MENEGKVVVEIENFIQRKTEGSGKEKIDGTPETILFPGNTYTKSLPLTIRMGGACKREGNGITASADILRAASCLQQPFGKGHRHC